ncbi:hypothetical protein [Paenibacillus pini]|uniref:Uncharacterized protein n=1 Tax=Paenibacillus pini JCM 16418 TaxID=1236976 RepID=W7Z1M1_9BACL|nr:hypothetical protein JCM16418_5118 [Paenibacillus pini JCM 16418]
MDFTEIKPKPNDPRFTLTMSLVDAIDLWRLVCFAEDQGIKNADRFVEALTEFASDSNSYIHYLKSDV